MTKRRTKTLIFYYIDYIAIRKFDDYESIYSVNSFYLRINHASGYIEEKNGIEYWIFDSADEIKEVLKNYADVEMELKKK